MVDRQQETAPPRTQWAIVVEMKVRGAAGVVVALVLSATVPVWSQETPPVQLEIFHCDTMDEQEVQRIFAAELGARLASEPRTETTQVIVECMGDRSLLRVRVPITRKGLSRAIALRRGEPEAHARLVAIAATELVLASWSELKVNPEPKVEPEGPEVSDAVVEAALRAFTVSTGDQAEPPRDRGRRRRRGEPPPSELRLLAIGSLRGFKEHRGLIWGGGVRAAEDLSDTVSWSLDGLIESGDLWFVDQQWRVRVTTLGASVFFFHRWPWMTARLGGGLRMGVAEGERLEPAAAEAASFSRMARPTSGTEMAALGWPLLTTSLTVKLARSVVLELSAEGSYVLGRAPEAASQQPAIAGAWFGCQLGLGLSL